MWRGIACVMVLINHASAHPAPGPFALLNAINGLLSAVADRLWAGVPIFFVISGYCITATIDSHRRRKAAVSHYFLRRFRRIFPPYWVVLIGGAVLVGGADLLLDRFTTYGASLIRPWWFSPWQWAGSITLTEIWRYHLIGGPKGLLLPPAWTLCYEEQFYAVGGALLLLAPRRFFLGASVVTAGVLVTAIAGARAGWPIDGFFFDGAWLQFAMGILLYWVLVKGSARERWTAGAVFVLVMVGAASYGAAAMFSMSKTQPQVYFIAALFAFVALVLHPYDARLASAKALMPVQRCGWMCYSLYLVHAPLIGVMRAVFASAGFATEVWSPLVTIPLFGAPALWVAWRFHLAVERHFMELPPAARKVSEGAPSLAF
jgi:peptidoglycan/LPS O-acetylase OafA/YrhL